MAKLERLRFRRTLRPGELPERERVLLALLVQMHSEFGLSSRFTSEAVALITGEPCAGSLAGLTMAGYIAQRNAPEGIVYCVTENGYAKHAGIEGLV